MLSRGIFDAISIWPAVFWPIVFSSCFFAFVRLCQMQKQRFGFSPIGGRRRADLLVTYLVVPGSVLIEVAVHSYMLFVAGYVYVVVAIPVYIFGWILLPAILDGFRPGMTILAMTHATFVMAFAVLLGFADVNLLRALNSDIYGLLVGVPANL